MIKEDEIYLRRLISEAQSSAIESNEITDEMVDEICRRLDEMQVTLNENSYSDITSSAIWSIIDIIMAVCTLGAGNTITAGAKGVAKGGAEGIKKAIQIFREAAANVAKTEKFKKAHKASKRGMAFMMAASLLQCLQIFKGTPWEGQKIGAREKLPLVGTENLKNLGRKVKGAIGGAARTAGMFFEPLNSIGEYTDKLRNAARKLSNKMLASEQELLKQKLAASGKGLLGRLWGKITGTLKNVFLNKNTSTDNVYYPEYFDLCKERGIDLTEMTTTIGAQYRSLLTKTYGKQLDENSLNQLISQNVQNASTFFHLDASVMAQGAGVAGTTNGGTQNDAQGGQNGVSVQGGSRQPNPVISQFQEWAASQNITDDTGQPLQADGLVGPKTRSAIMKFQQMANQNGWAQNMPVDGKWGPLTAAAFQNAQNGAQPQPAQQEQPQTDANGQQAVQQGQSQTDASGQQAVQTQTNVQGQPLTQNNMQTQSLAAEQFEKQFSSLLERMNYIKNNGSIIL